MTIPNNLPKCKLLRALGTKFSARSDVDFDFWGHLNAFRQRVSEEVRQINVLFPEYTPHDEQYHLTHMFHIADEVLGDECLKGMNSSELFVLAVALYGHDWGMAVSESEKHYILTGQPPEGVKAEELWILPNEREQQLNMDDLSREDISDEDWREYVRQTHAFRSGERVRCFFEPINRGVADAASRVCEGHWLDFKDLQDPDKYPRNFSVLRETVNLRALAVYLRLIDLLDLGEDRTPYATLKFVAPRDPCSRMEWRKHRALSPVTCPAFLNGRSIQVDGSTDDHEVYAALLDLRDYCEEQLDGCNELLARMNDPRHKLDFYRIDWRVEAQGFEPVSIRFEFDRGQMFEILGDEIYQGDPYVFLRELLQNSIDAIRMRREVLKRKGLMLADHIAIRVNVKHGENGDALVIWSDDGIGMDEHIVREYLAVAGKSYYHSADFEREGLKLDLISRFGIGVLSYFMVANRIEIETFKEPQRGQVGRPLRIKIPAKRRQFRIETLSPENAQVGTTVRVFVKGSKLFDEDGQPLERLDVTAYLSIVAGFVEFPIVVSEGERKTIILHPDRDAEAAEAARQRFDTECQVQQLDLSYPWEEAIFPQDLPTAREMLKEERFDLGADLGLEGYEGFLAYLVPINDKIDLKDMAGDSQSTFIIQGQVEPVKTVRHSIDWWLGGKIAGISRSSSHQPSCAVYRDGILLATASPPALWDRWNRQEMISLLPKLVVNLSKSKTPEVDLARTQPLKQAEHWSAPVFLAHPRHLLEKSRDDLLAMSPVERLYQLGRFATFHRIKRGNLWHVFPHERWPVPFLQAGGRVDVLEWGEVKDDPLYLSPQLLEHKLQLLYRCQGLTQGKHDDILARWNGERFVVAIYVGSLGGGAVRQSMYLWQAPIKGSYHCAAIQFLRPPWDDNPPLLQEIWLPQELPREHPNVETMLERVIDDPTALDSVRTLLARARMYIGFSDAIVFPQPFERSFAYGGRLNLNHPIAQSLIRCEAALKLAKMHNTMPEDRLGHLDDTLGNVRNAFPHQNRVSNIERLPDAMRSLWSLVRQTRLFDIDEIEDLIPSLDEFVPGTIGPTYERVHAIPKDMKSARPFGMPST